VQKRTSGRASAKTHITINVSPRIQDAEQGFLCSCVASNVSEGRGRLCYAFWFYVIVKEAEKSSNAIAAIESHHSSLVQGNQFDELTLLFHVFMAYLTKIKLASKFAHSALISQI
jgi:hypothetical protein